MSWLRWLGSLLLDLALMPLLILLGPIAFAGAWLAGKLGKKRDR